MTCDRCGGDRWKPERLIDLNASGVTCIEAWTCRTCGNVIDPVILRNRAGTPPGRVIRCRCGCGQTRTTYARVMKDRYFKGHKPHTHFA